MRIPIYIETQGPDGQFCGDNCIFLDASYSGVCLLFSEGLERVNENFYDPVYIRCTRCVWFDEDGE